MVKCFLGIDPGFGSGAAAFIAENYLNIWDVDFKENFCGTVTVIGQQIQICRDMGYAIIAAIEHVSSSPQQGVASAFNFGSGFGALQAVLCAWQVPYVLVRPQKWQAAIDSIPARAGKVSRTEDMLDQKSADKAYRSRKAANKGAVFQFCKRMFPTAELQSVSKDSDRSDALGIAYWLSKQP